LPHLANQGFLGDNMKKLYLAASIVTAMAAMNTQAAEVFKQGSNSLDIGGYANLMLSQTSGSDKIDVADNSSRINFSFNKGLKSGWSTQAKYEFGLSGAYAGGALSHNHDKLSRTSSNPLSSRLAYVGLMHDKYGKIIIGKNWGVYSGVAGVADPTQKFGTSPGTYELDSGGASGTGRAEKVLQYHNAIGPVSLGLQVQPYEYTLATGQGTFNYDGATTYTEIHYGMGYGVSLKYNIMDVVEVGVAYNAHDILLAAANDADDSRKLKDEESVKSTAMAASIQYGDHGKDGLFLGFVYASAENHMAIPEFTAFKTSYAPYSAQLAPEATSMNLAVSYKVDDFTPMVGYYTTVYKGTKERNIFGNEDTELSKTTLVVGLSYDWTDDWMFYVEAALDMSDNDETKFAGTDSGGNTIDGTKFVDEFKEVGTGYALGMKYVF